MIISIRIVYLYEWNGLPWWFGCKEATCQSRRHEFEPWVEESPLPNAGIKLPSPTLAGRFLTTKLRRQSQARQHFDTKRTLP